MTIRWTSVVSWEVWAFIYPPYDFMRFSISPTGRPAAPLKSICSTKCDIPLPVNLPSVAEPALTTSLTAARGTLCVLLVITVSPLSRLWL